MFSKFFAFVGESSQKDIHSMEEFLGYCSGKSFLNGLYRIHYTADIPKWNDIVGKSFDSVNSFSQNQDLAVWQPVVNRL